MAPAAHGRPCTWYAGDIVDAVAHGLQQQADRVDAEQAVRGIDLLDEVPMHSLLAEALGEAGFSVHREQRYPAVREGRRRNKGERCDIVLTPKGRPLMQPDQAATLFEPANAVAPGDAYWLEVKLIAQNTEEGPNRSYASQLLSGAGKDIAKMSRDRVIRHGGLLLILFTDEALVAAHDLCAWEDRCLKTGLAISTPADRTFALTNRNGHTSCHCALYPVLFDACAAQGGSVP